MKKFKVTVVRTDEYEIEVDESVWTKETLKDWSEVFNKVDSEKDIAEKLALSVMRNGSASGFMEGFGIVKTLKKDGSERLQFNDDLQKATDENYAKGLTVTAISEDENYETEIEELN